MSATNKHQTDQDWIVTELLSDQIVTASTTDLLTSSSELQKKVRSFEKALKSLSGPEVDAPHQEKCCRG